MLTAMATPMREDGSIDYDEAARLANHLVDVQRNTGIVVSGTTAESPTLTDSEKLELLRVVLETVRQKAAVVFGAGTYDTSHSKHLTGAATEMGAHGVMAVSPYYNKPNQEGLYQHFRAIAQSTDLPVLLYNIQGRTSVNIETPTVIRLAEECENIVAVKEASGNLNQIADVAARSMEGFRVYSGDDALTLPILSVGGIGVVSVAAHIIGADIYTMMETFFKSPFEAVKMHKRMLPVIQALFCTSSPTPLKYALTKRGFKTHTLRLPMIPANEEQRRIVDAAMESYEAQGNLVPG